MTAPVRRSGFTLVELVIAVVIIGITIIMAGDHIEEVQSQSRTRASAAAEALMPRRMIQNYAAQAYTVLPTGPQTTQIDSVSILSTPVLNAQLARVPRFQFVMTDIHVGANARPDTFALDFHPYLTQIAGYNVGDYRP